MTTTHMRPFLDLLAEQSKGKTKEELTEALHDLVTAVTATGKKGTLTLKLTVEPLKDSDGSMVKVADQVVVSLPRRDRKPSLFYAADGNLQRDDPNQQKFEGLTVLDSPTPATSADQKEAR